VLLSPHLTGWPSDERASQVLRYTVTARALLWMADQITASNPDANQAAMLDRAEQLLGQPPELEEAMAAR
jgi:hypothetical protein